MPTILDMIQATPHCTTTIVEHPTGNRRHGIHLRCGHALDYIHDLEAWCCPNCWTVQTIAELTTNRREGAFQS
jgi:hypothetical protein